MWDFNKKLNWRLSSILFEIFTNKKNALNFNSPKNKKGRDQDFLNDYFYPFAIHRATIHDSFLCTKFFASQPWPTKRQGDCFVGCIHCECNDLKKEIKAFGNCPLECRPKNHTDWIYC